MAEDNTASSHEMLEDVAQDFILILSANAELVYVTENVKRKLGINQVCFFLFICVLNS